MIKYLFCAFGAFLLNSSIAQSDYINELNTYRDSINHSFSEPETTILTEKDLEDFSALEFFEGSAEWLIKAEFTKIKGGEVFEMKTSTDRLPKYRPFGYLKFEIDGKKFQLTVYQNVKLMSNPAYSDYLFLPFTDLTNGNESYGGGRYLDFRIGDLENPVIDFNKSYNPYCAYNNKYSCPIPPMENHLDIEIKAGVKAFGDHH